MPLSIQGVRIGIMPALFALLVAVASSSVLAQQKSSLIPTPKTVTTAEAADLAKFDNQLIELPAVKVVHTDKLRPTP